MKRIALTLPILAVGVWGYTEFRPAPASGTSAAAITVTDTGRVVMRRMWKVPGADNMRMGSVTPDGRYIPVGAASRNQNIRLLDLTDRTIHEVVEPLDVAEDEIRFTTFPDPSPDGEWMAFSEGSQGGTMRPAPLRIVRLDGSGGRSLYDGSMGTLWNSDWSPDGSRILGWTYGMSGNSIVIVDVESAEISILKSVEWRVPGNPQFSPDGRFVAYSMQPDSTSRQDIYVIATDGSREVRAVEHPADDVLLAWTPDGALLFRSDRRGANDFWALAMHDGRPVGDPVLAVPDVPNARTHGFTRSGDFLYEVRVGLSATYIANLDAPGSGTVESVTPGGSVARALWSPDGDYLASTQGKTLTIRATETGTQRSVPVAVGTRVALRSWSPDGRSVIAETVDSRGSMHFARVDVETGGVTELMRLQGGQTSYTPVLSPDQKTLYFAHVPVTPDGPGTGSLVARDIATGEERTVFTGPADRPYVWEINLSPDGARFAVTYGRRPWLGASNTIAVVTTDGDARDLVVARADEEFNYPRWTPDGRSIVYMRSDRNGTQELWRIAAAGGAPEPIRFPEDLPPIGVLANFHPDGRRFTYLSRFVTELWVMEDLAGAVREALAEAAQR
jgi:Tol biopolymer transport system component